MAEKATATVDLEALKERQPTQDELDAIGLEALNEGEAKTICFHSITCSNRDVIKKTKPHRTIWFGMMTWWSD